MNKLTITMFSWMLVCGVMASSDRVLLSDVTSVTLHHGGMTTGRRSSPIPQASCVGGSARCPNWARPSVIQCTNKGSDGVDAQWECVAELDSQVKFGVTDMVCEGYDYPTDDYVLVGSCGLEYTLDWTDEGRHSFESDFSGLFVFGVLALAVFLCCGPTSVGRSGGSGFWGGAAGGYALGRMSRGHRGYSRGWGGGGVSRGFGRTRRR